MRIREKFSWEILYLLAACVFAGGAEANSLFSIDCHLPAVVRVYAIDGDNLGSPVTISAETIGLGPVGIAASMDLGLDLGISSCYNKIILLSGKMLGIRETFERERSKS